MSGQKSHVPTKKRLKNARRDGKIAKSAIVTQCASYMGLAVGLSIEAQKFIVRTRILLEYSAGEVWLDPERCVIIGIEAALRLLGAALFFAALFGTAAEVLQNRFQFQPGLFVPRLSRIEPLSGVRRLMKGSARRATIVLGRAPLCAVLMGAAIWPLLADREVANREAARDFVVKCGGRFAVAAAAYIALSAIFAGLDYWWARKALLRELSMSEAEVRRERRDDEGDPLHKAARRAAHQALCREDLVRRVRNSKVIVVERAKE
jgi:flagellar biosynthesis protein FlhB